MSESHDTGYGESTDTDDGPVAEAQKPVDDAGAPADEDAPTLTTDEDAQHDDSVLRPGNAAG